MEVTGVNGLLRPEKVINGYTILTEAVHPVTGAIYRVGDRVKIYQGRFGHNNIMVINSMFKFKEIVYVTNRSYTES